MVWGLVEFLLGGSGAAAGQEDGGGVLLLTPFLHFAPQFHDLSHFDAYRDANKCLDDTIHIDTVHLLKKSIMPESENHNKSCNVCCSYLLLYKTPVSMF